MEDEISYFTTWETSRHSNITLKEKKTIMSGVGFEPTPPFGDQNAQSHCVMGRYHNLESGALDRSAILTHMSDTVENNSCRSKK